MPDQAVALLILGVAAGILSGMFGIGGGVVIVPVLVALFSFELRHAIATSLGALMMPVAILAVITYYRAGLLRVRTAVAVSAGLFIGVVLGAQIQDTLNIGNLEILYGIFSALQCLALSRAAQMAQTRRADRHQRPGDRRALVFAARRRLQLPGSSPGCSASAAGW